MVRYFIYPQVPKGLRVFWGARLRRETSVAFIEVLGTFSE